MYNIHKNMQFEFNSIWESEPPKFLSGVLIFHFGDNWKHKKSLLMKEIKIKRNNDKQHYFCVYKIIWPIWA